MGAFPSLAERRASQRNEDIEQSLEQEKLLIANRISLLLLGAAESGKSTLSKQMKIIHERGFTADDRKHYRSRIHGNLVQATMSIIESMRNSGNEFRYSNSEDDIQRIFSFSGFVELQNSGIDVEMADAMKRLWSDSAMKRQLVQLQTTSMDSLVSVEQMDDSTEYFLDNLNRITQEDYIPTEQDVLRSRLQTVGVMETHFHYNGYIFRMYDVGGQRSERRKWIHFFDNVSAVIYTAALSGYDQLLREDPTKNRMHESLDLFEWVCSQEAFACTTFFLFLNKKDIFEKKIEYSPLSVCFPEYEGKNTYEEASKYIRSKFEEVSLKYDRKVLTYFTNATDTAGVDTVFRDATCVAGLAVKPGDEPMFKSKFL